MRFCVKANKTDDWHALDLLGYTHSKERPIIANISVADFILINLATNEMMFLMASKLIGFFFI